MKHKMCIRDRIHTIWNMACRHPCNDYIGNQILYPLTELEKICTSPSEPGKMCIRDRPTSVSHRHLI